MKSLIKKTQDIFSQKRKINKDENSSLNKNDFFCCPKCQERIMISLNPVNFKLSYNCENNHKESNLDYNIFYQNRYLNRNCQRYCQQCKKVKLNNNKIINCNVCNMKICGACILKHKNMNKHENFGLIYNSIKKCPKHDIDISLFCKTCQKNLCSFCIKKNDEENEHNNHEIVNFSDLIPGENEIKNNELKLKQKINKNNSIINKLINWKEEMCSLIDEIIDKLNKDKLINKMIIQNFNWKYLDYINYKNYEMATQNLEILNEELEKFYKSKMFIEQTNAITDYLFGKEHRKNDIINDNKEKEEKKIDIKKLNENQIKKEININIINNLKYNDENINEEKNILNILKNEKALLYNNNCIYSYSLEDKNILKAFEDSKDKNKIKGNKMDNVYSNLNNLNNNLKDKLGNYNILIWKMEEDLKKDKLINLIKKEQKKINKFENIRVSDNNNFSFITMKKKEVSKININKFGNIQISDNNNFNFIKIKKKEEAKININNENENRGSNDNLLFSETNSLLNSNINNNNDNFNSGLFSGTINNNTRLFTNYELSNIHREQEREEEYVYISRTGSKYHGRPTCGRMKVSTKVTLSKAESLGLGPCMKCY